MRQYVQIIFFSLIAIPSYCQNCSCPDYEFSSSKYRPIIEVNSNNTSMLVCGYSNVRLDNGYTSGVIQNDSSVYLSGFNIFSCQDQPRSLISFGEVNIFKAKSYKNYIELDLMMNLPVSKDLNYKYTPLIRYKVLKNNNDWEIGKPSLILDLSSLTDNDFFKIKKDLGWDNLYPEFIFTRDDYYPEHRIMYAFLVAIKYFPNYNQDFAQLGELDGYIAELHDRFLRILKELE